MDGRVRRTVKLARDWTLARFKVEREGKCRVCGGRELLAAAHTAGQKHDRARDGTRSGVLVVDPDDIVPLCVDCHTAYDQRRLDLLPHLTNVEAARAVLHLGLVSAYKRLTSSRDSPDLQAAA